MKNVRPLLLCLQGLLLATLVWVTPAAAQQEGWFTTEALNPGLSDPPDVLDRRTPLAAMESFLYLAERDRFTEAAHLLDLSDLPEDSQPLLGERLARELAVVLERKVVIPWSSLADRPDGWLTGSSDDNSTGRVRRSILIDRLEVDTHLVPIRINRVKAGEDADAVWVFSRQSVDNIPRLYRFYGPTALENSLPDWARAEAFWGMYVWEVLFIPVLIFVALASSLAVYRVMKRLGERTPQRWGRFVARSLKWPLAITLCAAIIGISTRQILVVSGVIDAILSPLLLIAYVVSATLALVLIIDEIFDMISQNNPDELADPENSHMRAMATTISAARKAVIVIAVLVGTGVVLASINTLNTVGLSLLASAGALTLILGFAAREVLGNILASVQIALNRSARIGDQLMFEGHFCTVERIHFTYVQLIIWNGNRLIVPVSHFVGDAFENWSLEDPAMVRPIKLTLAQTADVEQLRRAFFDLLDKEDQDDVSPRSSAKVHVTGQDVFGVKVRVELPTSNPATGWEIECRVREGLLAEAARIECESGTRMLPPAQQDLPDN